MVLHVPRSGGMRLCQPEGVHLVVLQHQHSHPDVVDLYTEHMLVLQLHRIYHAVGQEVCGGIAGHRHHLFFQLFQLADTGIAVADELPVGIGGCRIANLQSLSLHVLRPHQVGHAALYPAPQHGGVAVHLCIEVFQAHTTDERVIQVVVLRHKQRQTIQRRQHCYLQRRRLTPVCLYAVLTGYAFCLLIALSAGCQQQQTDYDCR